MLFWNVVLFSSCVSWRCTVCVKASTAVKSSRMSWESRWWSSCSVWKSWSFTAACAGNPSARRTNSFKPCPALTYSTLSTQRRFNIILCFLCSSLPCVHYSGVCRRTVRRAARNVTAHRWSWDLYEVTDLPGTKRTNPAIATRLGEKDPGPSSRKLVNGTTKGFPRFPWYVCSDDTESPERCFSTQYNGINTETSSHWSMLHCRSAVISKKDETK